MKSPYDIPVAGADRLKLADHIAVKDLIALGRDISAKAAKIDVSSEPKEQIKVGSRFAIVRQGGSIEDPNDKEKILVIIRTAFGDMDGFNVAVRSLLVGAAADALADGKGVCQDHAHVLISAARHLGIPARYVSGYLFADQDGKSHEASHAWAELHLPELGWVGFDPANRCCPTDYYIRLGSGLDAQGGFGAENKTEGQT